MDDQLGLGLPGAPRRRALGDTLSPAAPWPQAPAAGDEPRTLPLDGTLEARYRAWRATDDGARVYEAIRIRALGLFAGGAQRISVNACMEHARNSLKLPCNNTWRAPIARDLIDDCPALKHAIELRKRTAA